MTATGMGLWEAIGALPEVNVIDPYEQGIPPLARAGAPASGE